jgi:hypothetical protein
VNSRKTQCRHLFFLETNEPPNEQLEEEWQNQISERLSSLLQGLEESTVNKSDVCPFDALSEVPVDDQRFENFVFSLVYLLVLDI